MNTITAYVASTSVITFTETSITETITLTDNLGGLHTGVHTFQVGKLGVGSELHLLSNGVPACRNRSRRWHSVGRRKLSEVTCIPCAERRDRALRAQAEQAALGA